LSPAVPPPGPVEEVRQGDLEAREAEAETRLEKAPRNDALPLEDDGPELSQEQTNGECRGTEKRRTAEGPAQGLGQVAVPDGIGGADVDRPGNIAAADEEKNGRGQIIDMNPGKPLTAVAQRPPEPEFIEWNHLAEGSPRLSEDQSESGQDDAVSVLGRLEGRLFPTPGDLGQEVVAGGPFFVQLFVVAEAIIADGRGAQEDGRRPGPAGEGGNDIRRRFGPAFHDLPLAARSPFPENRSPGQVDNGIARGHGVLPKPGSSRIALKKGQPLDRFSGRGTAPAEDDDLVPSFGEDPGESRPDESRPARQENIQVVRSS